jgi:hypothetical protein
LLKLGLKGHNDCIVMEEGGGLAQGEGGSHGSSGAAARQREAGHGGCLALDGVRDEARTMGHLGQASREAKWAGRWWRVLLGMLSQQGNNFSHGHMCALS